MRRPVSILALLLLALGATTAHANEACTSAPHSPFIDTRRSSVHARSMDCLYWYRVTTGTGVDTFTPRGTVTRDQMASFVVRVIAAAGRPPPPPGDVFKDLARNVHRRPIERLRAAELVHGIATDRYGPKLEVPRGQMAAFLVRTWRYVTHQAFPPARDAFEDDDGHRFEGDINVAYALGLAKGRSSGEFDPDGLTSRAEMASFLTRLIERLTLDSHLSPRAAGFESRVRVLPRSLERLNGRLLLANGLPRRVRRAPALGAHPS